jgi:type IV secretory pathway VirD2 relaxase
VTYARNTVRGQWRAHGRYVARESAAGDKAAAGFDRADQGIDVGTRLGSWQAARDQRLWKIIISPEFGERVDLSRLTRDLMARVEHDQGTPLEWVAVAHFNTEHPHVHVAVRGLGGNRQPVHLNRDYVKHGIRSIAEDLCTRQLGHRTALDADEAERREIREKRFTSLDRKIANAAQPIAGDSLTALAVTAILDKRAQGETARTRQQYLVGRLAVLEEMGLAQRSGPATWNVRSDFETILRAMQRAGDRQKVMAAHGVPLSDERLPVEVLDLTKTSLVAGRVLVHGEDEQVDRSYLVLEGIDARVHFIHYTPEMEEARARGELRTNSFARLRRIFVDGEPVVQVEDLGDSEAFLNSRQLESDAGEVIRRGVLPTEDGWGGWLGRYQRAFRRAAMELEFSDIAPDRDRVRDRSFDR